jgi:Resolvase, N terminal domain
MNGSTKIQPTHLKRQAVVFLRQSTPQQVLKNRESALNQPNLRDRPYALGWRKDQILLIDEDQGQTGKQTIGREGFQGLLADVSLRRVGIIIGYEVSRVFRKERGDDLAILKYGRRATTGRSAAATRAILQMSHV